MITGHTHLCCLLADPVEHVRTPQMFNAYLDTNAVDAIVVALKVTRADLTGVVAGLRRIGNMRAIIVTIPHKIAMIELCDVLHDRRNASVR
jgi:shikimate dehydrogenase